MWIVVAAAAAEPPCAPVASASDLSCPDGAELCTNVGYAHLVAGDLDQARRELLSCGDGATTLLNLGDAYAREGWANPARDAYRRALAAGLTGVQADRASAALAALGPDEAVRVDRPCLAVVGRGDATGLVALCSAPVDPATGSWVGTRLYRSADLGRSWVALRPDHADAIGLARTASGALVVHATGPYRAGAATVTVSTDGGRTFAVHPAEEGGLMALADTLVVVGVDGAWTSTDLGVTWAAADLPEGTGRVVQVGGTWLAAGTAATGDDGWTAVLRRSADRGASWTTVGTWSRATYTSLDAIGAAGDRWLVTGWARNGNGGGAWAATTADAGRTWSEPAMAPELWAHDDAVDDGSRWTAVWTDPWVIGGRGDRCSTQYAPDGVGFRLVRSQPEAMAQGVSALWGAGKRAVAVGPGGLFVSEDGGATWLERTP